MVIYLQKALVDMRTLSFLHGKSILSNQVLQSSNILLNKCCITEVVFCLTKCFVSSRSVLSYRVLHSNSGLSNQVLHSSSVLSNQVLHSSSNLSNQVFYSSSVADQEKILALLVSWSFYRKPTAKRGNHRYLV